MEQVRIGVIGIGNMGSNHCKSINNGEIPGLVLTAVADVKEKRKEWVQNELPETIKIFTTATELFASGLVDAVIIAVPHYDHPRLVMEALAAGLHVMCEKPAGVYTKQVREMNEAAAKSNLVFGMMFNQRTNHIYRKLHEITQQKTLGELKRMNWIVTDWYRTQSYYDSGEWRATWEGEGGGVLLNQCPHNLDLIQWIFGMPSKVQAHCHMGKWHNIEVEDDVTAYLEFPNGATGVFITSTGDAPGTNRLEADYEKGKVVCENNKIELYELDVNEREFCFTATEGFKKPTGQWVAVETDGLNPQHIGVLKAFTDRILHGTDLVADGIEGINGLTLSNAMHLSSWQDKMIEIPFDEELFLVKLNELRTSSRKKKETGERIFDTNGSY